MTDTADLLDERPRGAALGEFALREDYALNPRFVAMVVDAADRGDLTRLRELVTAVSPPDVADLMGFLSAEHREDLVPLLPPEVLAEVLPELDDQIRDEVLERVAPATLATALGELDSDDAAAVVEDLDAGRRGAVLAAMSPTDRAAIETTLAYAEESAGRLMQREVLAAPQFWTVAQTLEHVRSAGEQLPELFFDVYVVSPAFKVLGGVPVSALLKARPDAVLGGLMEPVTEIDVGQDQEEVAYAFEKYHLVSAPVTDADGRLVGQITVDDIVNIIQEENQEDLLALAGVGEVGRDAGVFGIVRSRFPWLFVNLFTASIAVSVISAFQDSIAELVALAVLMPIVASIGGNAGTQALTVSVRALAMRELSAANAWRSVRREIVVGLINGVALACVLGAAAALLFQNPRLGGVIGVAVVLNLLIAALAGSLIPLALDRLGRDPAVASSVFVTMLTDLFGFLLFLGLATAILL
jgi:magnesium transporter